MIKVDWVGFEYRLDLGHKLGIEVEDSDGLLVHGVLGDVVSKFVRVRYVEFGRLTPDNGLVEGGFEYDILHRGDVVVDSHTLDNRNKLLDSGSEDFCDLSFGGELRDVEELLLN